MDQVIGSRLYVDGNCRPIYEDALGQYVMDDDGQRVDGLYLNPDKEDCDQPVIVDGDHYVEP
jgi:hypothetical protein